MFRRAARAAAVQYYSYHSLVVFLLFQNTTYFPGFRTCIIEIRVNRFSLYDNPTRMCDNPLCPFHCQQVDEYGRMVYDEEVRPPPTKVDEQEPFWEGWSADKLGLNGEEVHSSWTCIHIYTFFLYRADDLYRSW